MAGFDEEESEKRAKETFINDFFENKDVKKYKFDIKEVSLKELIIKERGKVYQELLRREKCYDMTVKEFKNMIGKENSVEREKVVY